MSILGNLLVVHSPKGCYICCFSFICSSTIKCIIKFKSFTRSSGGHSSEAALSIFILFLIDLIYSTDILQYCLTYTPILPKDLSFSFSFIFLKFFTLIINDSKETYSYIFILFITFQNYFSLVRTNM